MNKAAERWRKWAHIGKGKGGGGVWCLGQRDGGVGREKRGKEKHTHTYTLAKNEQKNEPLLLHPPAVKWQFQFCQQTSPATMLPEEAAEGEYTHRLFQTQGMQGLKTTEKSCLRLDTLTPLSESETKAASARLWVIESPCRLSSTFEQQFGTFCQ